LSLSSYAPTGIGSRATLRQPPVAPGGRPMARPPLSEYLAPPPELSLRGNQSGRCSEVSAAVGGDAVPSRYC
jgi:hypothetical protein